MTLFSLNKDKRTIARNFYIYCGVVVFCIVFGIVYESFSHGVVSFFTLYGFLFPLVLGLAPYFTLLITKSEKGLGNISSNAYNAGVATITVGSYFKGMLDIYGTTRDVYVVIYFAVGGVLFLFGLATYLISIKLNSRSAADNKE